MSIYLLACMLSGALAQYGGGGAASSSTATAAATSAAASAAASNVHSVAVGKNGLVFTPDTLTAAKGDIIEFTFVAGHSVERSTFSDPCNPISTGAIYSGFPSASDQFTVTVNDTNPIWLYCSQISHCQSGMVMVINPPSSGANTLAAYKSAAQSATLGTSPASVQGGIIGPVGKAVTSSSASAASSAAASSAGSSSAAASPSSTGSAAFSKEVKWAMVLAVSLLWVLHL